MAASIFGLASLTQEAGAVLVEENSGLVTFNESIVGKTADVVTAYAALVRFTTANGTFLNLKLDSKKVLFDEGGQAKLQLVWAGPDAGSGTPVDPEPIWSLKRSPSEEPIDTHPNFPTFGISANGAEFDENGIFIGFKVPTSGTNVWGGLSKYMEKAAVITKTSIVSTFDSDEEIPRINTPSGAPFTIPTITGRNWMKTDLSAIQRGASFEVFEEWTMSGQQGWNTTVYP
jgi:hypothetical protein